MNRREPERSSVHVWFMAPDGGQLSNVSCQSRSRAIGGGDGKVGGVMRGQGRNGGGRPTKMGPEVLLKLEDAFAWGATGRKACLYAESSPSTLYRYQRENGEFLDRKHRFRLRPILKARVTLAIGILADPYLALRYLEKKLPAEFGRGR